MKKGQVRSNPQFKVKESIYLSPTFPRAHCCSPQCPSTSKISSRLIPHLWSLNDHKGNITSHGHRTVSPTLCCCFQALLSFLTSTITKSGPSSQQGCFYQPCMTEICTVQTYLQLAYAKCFGLFE